MAWGEQEPTYKKEAILVDYASVEDIVALFLVSHSAYKDDILIDKRNNTITAKLPEATLKELQALIKKVDKPAPQVQVKSYFFKTTQHYARYLKEEIPKHQLQEMDAFLTEIDKQHKITIMTGPTITGVTGEYFMLIDPNRKFYCECTSEAYEKILKSLREHISISVGVKPTIKEGKKIEIEMQITDLSLNTVQRYKVIANDQQALVFDDIYSAAEKYGEEKLQRVLVIIPTIRKNESE